MWAVVPAKDLVNAKTRLASALDVVERRRLFALMLEDVLTALAATPALAGILVVTRDAPLAALARRFGAEVLTEAENRGHTAAVVAGARWLMAQAIGALLTVPGDVPLITPAEVGAAIAALGEAPAVTIVPARDHLGSNAVLATPPDALPLRFGADSFHPHLTAARARGIEPRVVELPGIGLDIDTAADLAELVRRPVATRAQAWLAAAGITARLARARQAVA
ncbi:MAG: 2-phospho-L-lactate guanylyltransferase [Alphaproteobacteria bacterium]|nr:2-phospho-L-lactate guanylyltransferase [Alphaproteobacteria bacterium]